MNSEMAQMIYWREGKLFEISPLGTGFVEEAVTGRVYGFHRSMLAEAADWEGLEGAAVRFQIDAAGSIGVLICRESS